MCRDERVDAAAGAGQVDGGVDDADGERAGNHSQKVDGADAPRLVHQLERNAQRQLRQRVERDVVDSAEDQLLQVLMVMRTMVADKCSPDVYQHVCEEAPELDPSVGVVDEGALDGHRPTDVDRRLHRDHVVDVDSDLNGTREE